MLGGMQSVLIQVRPLEWIAILGVRDFALLQPWIGCQLKVLGACVDLALLTAVGWVAMLLEVRF